MARGLSSAVKTELATGNVRPILLVYIGFATPVYLTNCSFDLVSSVSGSSQTYTASGHLRGITNISETNTPTKNSLALSLSGVEQTYIAVALNENIINKEVKIWRGFLDSSNSLISDPFLLFYGTIDDFKINDTTETANLVLTITSHWGQFEKQSGRTSTSNSQQRFFSGDLGMEYAALTVRDLKWGRE
ncbi:MAG TPA: hypothetical protein VLB82_00175 [Thermodesulfobacteriota bacterium]|jgi:hypothetical protein|nr:hypothetical protein [Thermodesulfobacteriota bacterium]